jgi:hypothetical protein
MCSIFRTIASWLETWGCSSPPFLKRTFLRIEQPEARDCPSAYEWIGGAGVLWSNAARGNWNILNPQGQWVLAAAGDYPGKLATDIDSAKFDVFAAGNATLDVALTTPLNSLIINGWRGSTLTLAAPLNIQAGGNFQLLDNSRISLNPGVIFSLTNAVSTWTAGSIIGDATATFQLNGGILTTGKPVAGLFSNDMNLGVNMKIQQGGVFMLKEMEKLVNLNLTGVANTIDVGGSGTLSLSQHITVQGEPNTRGGIVLGAGHTGGTLAVQVEIGGLLSRPSVGGVPDQVAMGGSIHNVGGTVDVGAGELLNITGKDGDGASYLQQADNGAALLLESGANINASGTYQIATGKVTLTAPAGGSADELDGLGLFFSGTTALKIVDATPGTPGTVTVQGPITLAQGTTTTVNYNGGTNKSDRLDDKNGLFTLNGTLEMLGGTTGAPNVPLNFLDDTGSVGLFAGNFTTWIGDLTGATYAGNVVPVNGVLMYQVTITPPAGPRRR